MGIKPINEFANALTSHDLPNLVIDYAEIGIDTLIENDFLDEIPILQTIISGYKISRALADWIELKKWLIFISCVRRGEVSQDGLERRRNACKNGEKWFLKEAERAVMYLSKHTGYDRVKIHAELYIDYINGEITESDFVDYLDILDQLLISDIQLLLEISEKQSSVEDLEADIEENKGIELNFDSIKCSRLTALGLLSSVYGFTFGLTVPKNFIITSQGKYFAAVIRRSNSKVQKLETVP